MNSETSKTDLLAAMVARQSTRAFTAQAVTKETIETLLQAAMRAPSGTNTQPWRVYVLQGGAKTRLENAVCAAHDAMSADKTLAAQYTEEYDYYPQQWVSPYIDRRRECGFGLYGVLGIGKGDKDKMHAQHQLNYRFFGAPVGLMFTVNRIMGRGSLLDYGMFLQNVMLAAKALGLDTCPQAAWNGFHSLIKPAIGAGDDEMLVCGMALGYADTSAVVNTFRTTRVDAQALTTWVG